MTRLPLLRVAGAAMVCLLASCGDEATPTQPEPGFLVDPLSVLTDAQLRTPDDPDAPVEDPTWTQWVEQNHDPIRSLASETFADLTFLAPILGAKRVVQLGESGHGVREFSQLKVRLIKYLHQELGFDVVAIESSLFECAMADREVGRTSAFDVLDRCAFNVWHTTAVLELFEYLERTRSTARPLRLVGVDTQVSSIRGASPRPGFFHDLIEPFDPAYADSIASIDAEFLSRHRTVLASQHVYLFRNRERLIPTYDSLAVFLESRIPLLADAQERNDTRLGAQTARSTVAFIEQLTTESDASIEHRDRGMSDNLTFVTDVMYPDSKVIVWAHNFHVRYSNHEVQPLPAPYTMGHWQKHRLGEDVYTIGLYMYTGTTAANDRSVYAVAPAQSSSVESILYRTRRRWAFVDLSGAPTSDATSWMDGPVTANAWGVNPLSMGPRRQYDGILFAHTVSPPAYLR